MAKVADLKLTWTKSPSVDVTKVVTVVTIDGSVTATEFGSDPQELMITVAAGKSFSFRIDTYDGDDNVASSETYTRTLSDLESPQPATNLFSEIVAIRDEVPF